MDDVVSGCAQAPTPPPRQGLLRRWLFRALVLAGLATLLEGTSYFSWWVLDGHRFRYRRAHRQQCLLLREGAVGGGGADGKTVLESWHVDVHPYLGFSYDPEWPGHLWNDNPVSDWGFTDRANRSLVRRRGPNKAVVAILGGSVASMFSANGTEALARELRQVRGFAGKDIEFVNLAVGKYKQPQQLMAMNYALAAGADFDAAINIDGLNEIAWYRQGNGVSGIFHLYPLDWHALAAELPDPISRRQVGKVAYLAERRAQWAGLVQRGPQRWSITANLLWKWRDRQLAAEAAQAEAALQARKHEHLPYRARGPHNPPVDAAGMQAELVADWERCSLILHRLCQAHGIRYYHFLQPNQYVPGAKLLSPVEQKTAIQSDLPARPLIEQGYPLLRAAGRRLAAQGVRFHDLSMVFARDGRTLYFDNCCHFNHDGNEALAEAISRAIAETPEPPTADSPVRLGKAGRSPAR